MVDVGKIVVRTEVVVVVLVRTVVDMREDVVVNLASEEANDLEFDALVRLATALDAGVLRAIFFAEEVTQQPANQI